MRKLVLPLLLISAAVALTFYMARAAAIEKPQRDMQSFWAAAQHIRENPYPVNPGIGMRNPPFALPFVLPLRYFDYPTAFGIWTVLTIVLIAGCGRLLWGVFTPELSLVPAVLSLIFAPTFCLLLMGQLDALVLTGVTLFLWAVAKKKYYLAGASILLIGIKPHIVFFFLLAILFWTLRERRWRVFWGGVIAFSLFSLLAILIDRHVFAQYFQYVQAFTQSKDPDPNIAGLLYQISGRKVFAIIPELLGVIWFSFYWLRRRARWDWNREGLLCIVVSLFCSYYAYPYDEILILPAVLICAAKGFKTRFFVLFSLINIGYALYLSNTVGRLWGAGSLYLSWTGAAWLITYLACRPREEELNRVAVVGQEGV